MAGRDQDAPPAPPPTGRGRRVDHDDFPSALLGNRRTLSVHLPPGYDDAPARRYPVLYLHDGQNLFDPALAAFGVAWEADATADRLAAAGRIEPVILVGIANTPERLDEYAVHRDGRARAGGRGRLYGRFVVEEVKPFIDRQYRTRPGREDTAVAGSSMGGLISLYMAREHADCFSRCGVMSPALWWRRGRVFRDLEADAGWMRRVRFWLDVGTRESGRRGPVPAAVRQARRLVAQFDAAGLAPGRDYYYWEVAGGEHNEAAWAARFDKVLLYFFAR
jgi:predicted alpha/beta superfamily hydrolase